MIDLIHQRVTLECLSFGGNLYKAYRILGKYIAEKEQKSIVLLPDGSYFAQEQNIAATIQLPTLSDHNDMEKLRFALKNACFFCNAGKKIRTMPYCMEFEKPAKQKTAHELLKTAEQAKKSFQKINWTICL